MLEVVLVLTKGTSFARMQHHGFQWTLGVPKSPQLHISDFLVST